MRIFGAKKANTQDRTPYATAPDFCQIFEKDMNRLYLLSLLLTGDISIAEKCFVSGLDDSANANPVFREWTLSWARRTIVRNAIRMIQPRPTDNDPSSFASTANSDTAMTQPAEVSVVIELPAFDRFVFVMSVLERYSDQECSLLLDCTRADVITARIRALEQIGRSTELHRVPASMGSDKTPSENPESALHLQAISQIAASA